jgi:hypothetical protein
MYRHVQSRSNSVGIPIAHVTQRGDWNNTRAGGGGEPGSSTKQKRQPLGFLQIRDRRERDARHDANRRRTRSGAREVHQLAVQRAAE